MCRGGGGCSQHHAQQEMLRQFLPLPVVTGATGAQKHQCSTVLRVQLIRAQTGWP
jgi:hypothetical protein